MVTKHLTDDEVQQYALDRSSCERRVAEHIHFCDECRTKAEVYQLMITGIEQQSQPAFDFDLSAVVLKQLPSAVSPGEKLVIWISIFVCVGFLGTVFYFFRNFLDSMFKGIAGFSIYLIAISAITVAAWVFAEMYKKYQKAMRVLDL